MNGQKSKTLNRPFEDLPIMRLTVFSKGTYFFDEFKQDFTGDIRYSRLIDGKYLFSNKNMGSDNYENVVIFWVGTQVVEKLRPKQ